MLKLTTAIAATLALAAPAFATDLTFGDFGGGSFSTSTTGGVAVTGGVAEHGTSGLSQVENQQFSNNASGARADLTLGGNGSAPQEFDDLTPQDTGAEQNSATYSEGAQGSQTLVLNQGTGTSGFGEGVAKSFGTAKAGGRFGNYGFPSW